jgi:hypothetical protein
MMSGGVRFDPTFGRRFGGTTQRRAAIRNAAFRKKVTARAVLDVRRDRSLSHVLR